MVNDIQYELTSKADPAELLAFYKRQDHATTHSTRKLQRMLDNTFCMVTARRDGRLIGWSRGVTDGLWGRLAECKLDPEFQGPACVTRKDGRVEHDAEGIARQMAIMMIRALRESGVEEIDVLAYGTEVDFCEELGFKPSRGVVAMKLAADMPLPEPAASLSSGRA